MVRLRAVYVDDVVVGAICCRIEPPELPGDHERLYIMTLGVLAGWRRRAIGTKLLRRVLDSLARYPSVGEVYLHVQTSNEEAVEFYKVRSVTRAYPCVVVRYDGWYTRLWTLSDWLQHDAMPFFAHARCHFSPTLEQHSNACLRLQVQSVPAHGSTLLAASAGRHSLLGYTV